MISLWLQEVGQVFPGHNSENSFKDVAVLRVWEESTTTFHISRCTVAVRAQRNINWVSIFSPWPEQGNWAPVGCFKNYKADEDRFRGWFFVAPITNFQSRWNVPVRGKTRPASDRTPAPSHQAESLVPTNGLRMWDMGTVKLMFGSPKSLSLELLLKHPIKLTLHTWFNSTQYLEYNASKHNCSPARRSQIFKFDW